MFKKNQFRKASVAILISSSLFVGLAQSVKAADTLVGITTSTAVSGTVTLNYASGTSTVSAPLWTGSVPTSIAAKSGYQTCQYLKFPIQAALPFATMNSDVSIIFEVWSTAGDKVASKWISDSDWNPTDGPTMISWLECDDWLTVGTHSMVITTKQELSTNGLLSRYVEGKQILPFVVDRAVTTTTVKAVKKITCIKGKARITTTKKTCPKGYKKK
jgi:hypothetical protein